MNVYENKVAVVTGAGSGIGRELARQLAARGARLAISDVNERTLAETASLCRDVEVRAYVLDVASSSGVAAHARAVEADFSAAHFLFNNAGISLVASFEHTTTEELKKVVDINLWGVIHGAKAFLPLMLKQREGHIVNISSAFGFVGIPTQSAYTITKFGVRGLTESLWLELEGTGVQAVSVHPGGIKTNIAAATALGKFAGPYERRTLDAMAKALVTPPEKCARSILDGVAKGKRRIVTGSGARLLQLLPRLFPTGYTRILNRLAAL
jgi:short-subunit dehydrogenase